MQISSSFVEFLLDCYHAVWWLCFFDCPSDDYAMGLVHLFWCWYFILGPIGYQNSHEQDTEDLLVCQTEHHYVFSPYNTGYFIF